MKESRRDFLRIAAGAAAGALAPGMASAQAIEPSIAAEDRVFITNEDSNTIAVIDPRANTVETKR